MGSICSEHSRCATIHDHDTVCHCFAYDKHIKKVQIERHFKLKWSWTMDHELVLFKSLSQKNIGYNTPEVIVNLIKQFIYDSEHQYYITPTYICKEPRYLKHDKLLKKKLCSRWYSSKPLMFPVAIYSSNSQKPDDLIDACSRYAVREIMSQSQNCYPLRQTIYVDKHRVHFDLISMENIDDLNQYYLYEDCRNDAMHFILLSDNENNDQINNICSSIWCQTKCMSRCIFVTTGNNIKRSKRNKIELMAKQYNLPLIYVELDKKKSVCDLFRFAIKYYWFCDLNRN